MIRLLGSSDEAGVLAFLDRDHATNLILISDIVEYGMDNRGHIFHGDYYGSFRGEELRGAAALFNFGSMFLHAEDEDAAAELSRHMAGLEKTRALLLRAGGVGGHVRRGDGGAGRQAGQAGEAGTAGARAGGVRAPRSREARARFARPEDLEAVMELQRGFQLEYFGISTELEEEFGRLAVERMAGDGIVVAEVEGEVAAKVETMVRTRRMGLIGGVYTRPEHRGRGLAGECMSLLCARLLEGYEAAVLNVALSNQPALRLYRGLGFRHAADFRMAVFP